MRDNLSNILNHSDCISEEMMLNYLAGKLNPADQHRVEKHLSECELCSDAMEGLSDPGVSQKDVANLKELDSRIDALINKGEEKAAGQKWAYRIAAIIAIVAIFGGGLYYLQSVKKSEKVFTENFEPYRDTAHATASVVETAVPDQMGLVKEEKEKFNAENKQPEQPLSEQSRKDVSSQSGSANQSVTSTTTGTATHDATRLTTVAATTDKATDSKKDMPASAEKEARPVAADAETGTKKMEADESTGSVALSKNSMPAKPLREEALKSKSISNEKQTKTTAPSSYEFNAVLSDSISPAFNESLIKEGVKQYEAKNYTVAISNLQQVLNNDAKNVDALFYSGVSNLSLNDDMEAITQLESVLKNSPNKFSDAAKWYLSLAYIKKNKISKAKKLLNELSQGKSEFKSNAQKTLDELK